MADSRLVPAGISDDSAAAYNEMLDRLRKIDLTCLLVYLIDTVPSAALPYLAEQFHVMGYEGWLFADSDDARRNLIKAAIDLHRYKGTEYGILRALEVVGLSAAVQKWWEYGGDPFHFRVSVDVYDNEVSAEQQVLLTALINVYKAVRDWPDATVFNLNSRGGMYIGVSQQYSELHTVYPGVKRPRSLKDELDGVTLVDEDDGAVLTAEP